MSNALLLQCKKAIMRWLVALFMWLSVANCHMDQSVTIREDNVKYRDSQCSNDSMCPTWFICDLNENSCQCGKDHNRAIACDSERLVSAVLDCYCVTYDQDTESTYLGSCFYNCDRYNSFDGKRDPVYNKLPTTPELLIHNSVCTSFHRTGLLCGDCEDEHSPLVLSYNLSCVECPDGHKNWWKFILVAFVPLTFFYFFVVVFNINVTSSRLHGVVWFSQILSTPQLVRTAMVVFTHSTSIVMAYKVLLIFYSFWNLDILRSVIPDICLNVTTLQALALDYLLALYPFLLIILSYFIIVLYDRKCVFIVAVWKPFHKMLTQLQTSWNVRTSVIDSFATFFLLSYVKIISVSVDILIPTQIYTLGSNKSTFGIYYTPSVEYFGHEHLPYAILALTLLALFVCIPTLTLILYPFQFFQKFLSLFPFNWHFLRAFVDSYQGCYKDGTEPGTFDCRWFASVELQIRLILFITYGFTRSETTFAFLAIIFIIYLMLLINFQPFKTQASRYPSTDTVFFLLLSLCCIVLLGRDVMKRETIAYTLITIVLSICFFIVPVAYITGVVGFWLVSKMRCIRKLAQYVKDITKTK